MTILAIKLKVGNNNEKKTTDIIGEQVKATDKTMVLKNVKKYSSSAGVTRDSKCNFSLYKYRACSPGEPITFFNNSIICYGEASEELKDAYAKSLEESSSHTTRQQLNG